MAEANGGRGVNADSGTLGHPLDGNVHESMVRDQLQRILASPVFRNSSRCSRFLRYVVEASLQGDGQEIKERTIGVDVFGRLPDYDTNADHVVRSVAAEVRRRLAQYYVECAQPGELRLELHAGSYVPHFRLPNGAAQPPPTAAVVEQAVEVEARTEPASRPWFSVRPALAVVVVATLLIAALLAGVNLRRVLLPTAYQRFWAPFLASGEPVMLCFGGGARAEQTYDLNTIQLLDYERLPMRRMHVSDAAVLAGLVGVLQGNGRSYRILNRSFLTSFKELQAGPFVLIGALNNQWTMRITSALRFGFEVLPQGARVVDRENPSNNGWVVQINTPLQDFKRDYGIISRFRDLNTEQMALVVGGIGSWGTLAAGEFVIKEKHLAKLDSVAPRGWEKRNLQIVVSTDVIRGSSGPPVIQAVHSW